MTTQEFVKKECEQYAEKVSFQVPYNGTNDFYNEERLKTSKLDFSDGLTKGLEIAGEFAEWGQRNKYKQSGGKKGNGEWYRQSAGYGGGEPTFYTTSELLTIFLTEKYGK